MYYFPESYKIGEIITFDYLMNGLIRVEGKVFLLSNIQRVSSVIGKERVSV